MTLVDRDLIISNRRISGVEKGSMDKYKAYLIVKFTEIQSPKSRLCVASCRRASHRRLFDTLPAHVDDECLLTLGEKEQSFHLHSAIFDFYKEENALTGIYSQ